jgi:hypothetical protein
MVLFRNSAVSLEIDFANPRLRTPRCGHPRRRGNLTSLQPLRTRHRLDHPCRRPASHDWAATNPNVDFTVNANGTSVLLEAPRRFAPDAVFIFMSTNKVYGDNPNKLPLVEHETRWEVDVDHPHAAPGIPETMSIDHTMHSLFGVSKVAADLLVQEYGRYFGMKNRVLPRWLPDRTEPLGDSTPRLSRLFNEVRGLGIALRERGPSPAPTRQNPG